MLTHSHNFLIVTKRISGWYHFCKRKFVSSIVQVAVFVGTMQLTLSVAIVQMTLSVVVMQVLRFCCNCACGTFCYFLDLSDAIMQVTDSVAIMYLEVSAAFIQVTVSAANMWVTIFYCNYAGGVSIAVVQVVFSAVYYAHDRFYYHYAGGCLVTLAAVSSNNFVFLSLTVTLFFIELTRKHLKALYQVCISSRL